MAPPNRGAAGTRPPAAKGATIVSQPSRPTCRSAARSTSPAWRPGAIRPRCGRGTALWRVGTSGPGIAGSATPGGPPGTRGTRSRLQLPPALPPRRRPQRAQPAPQIVSRDQRRGLTVAHQDLVSGSPVSRVLPATRGRRASGRRSAAPGAARRGRHAWCRRWGPTNQPPLAPGQPVHGRWIWRWATAWVLAQRVAHPSRPTGTAGPPSASQVLTRVVRLSSHAHAALPVGASPRQWPPWCW